MRTIPYLHMDVFADVPLKGNGLAVCFLDELLSSAQMLDITREFKQFETIFLSEWTGDSVCARVFTMDGELPFAGHPVLGGVAALHEGDSGDTLSIEVRLSEKTVPVVSERRPHGFCVTMRQGAASFLGEITGEKRDALARAHNLFPEDLDASLPMEIVTTGLPYVLIPVRGCLARARITVPDLEQTIAAYGAAYTYLFDPETLEARTWDNLGLIEDSATGSAAGPLAAYFVRHGRAAQGQRLRISQGQYAHRPGLLTAWVEDGEVYVAGDAVVFARGSCRIP